MSPSRILLASCLFFIGGVAVASLTFFNQIIVLVAFIIGTFLLTIFWAHKRLVLVGMCIVAGALGITVYQNAASEVIQEREREVSLIARVVEEPEIRENSVHLVVREEGDSAGNILVTTSEFSAYAYGDRLRISGTLSVPKVFDDFNYQQFLAKDGVYSLMYMPNIELVEGGAYDGLNEKMFALILRVKQKFRDTLHKHISSPESAILGAVLLGDKSNLPEEMKEKLNAAGVRHITAISGMHVAILTANLMVLLIGIGLWRQQAFYVTIALMLLFIVLTGLQPSAVRAGIMGGMFLLGQHIGRLNVSERALVFAATVMLAFNPFLLMRDVGFQLSFLAVLGIIHFLPIFLYLFRKVPNPLHVREILGMTLAAQLFTLPILVANFGFVSFVSVLGNLLILPLLPLLFGAGYIFFLAGSFFEPAGFLLSLPVSLLLSYITTAVDVLANFPFASVRLEHLSLFWFSFLYLPAALLYWKFRKRREFLV
jgi:competence protein ComEC